MTNGLFARNGRRSAALALAAASLPLWLAGCSGDNDYDPIVPRNIDFCRLERPATIDAAENSVVTVYGRVYIAGLTDQSGGNDPDRAVIGAVGVGPDGSNPETDSGWIWFEGEPNASYGPATPDYELNSDEYEGELILPGPPDDYDFAFRFSGDAGETFTYCDTGLGTIDGYNPAEAGQVTTTASLLFREYVDGSNFNKAVEIYGASAGSVDLNACEVNIYANGSDTVTSSVALSGSLAPDELHVVCNSSAGGIILGACNTDSANFFYDGNDAVELACDGSTLDVIGRIGEDPGFEWASGPPDLVGTANETMRRDCDLDVGDSDGSDSFDPSDEWTSTRIPEYFNLGIDHCP